MKPLLLTLALLLIPSLTPAQQPNQYYGQAFGFGFNPYTGYHWQRTNVPLPRYNGYARYVIPQSNYQVWPTPYGFQYQYTTPSPFYGSGPFYVPFSGE